MSSDPNPSPLKLHPIYGRSMNEAERGVSDWLKSRFDGLHTEVSRLPPTRERALALTYLETASMWATKAVISAGDVANQQGTPLDELVGR